MATITWRVDATAGEKLAARAPAGRHLLRELAGARRSMAVRGRQAGAVL